jgi:hypothetical protein
MLVDACRNDPLMGRSVLNARSLQTLDDPPKGFMLLQSCSNGEESFEDDNLKHGVFTYSFIEGLRGEAADDDGNVTLFGLATHTIQKTARRAHALNSSQKPYMRGETTDFVLAKVSAKPSTSAPSQPVVQVSDSVPVVTEPTTPLDNRNRNRNRQRPEERPDRPGLRKAAEIGLGIAEKYTQ